MKKINLIIFLTLALFSLNSLGLSLKPKIVYIANKDLPVEMDLLVQSLQRNMDKEKRKVFQETLSRLDNVLKVMSKEERFFIIKSEIYKMLIKGNSKRKARESSYDPAILKNFDKVLSSDKKTYSPFSKWFIQAIKTDLENLFDSTLFNRYMSDKRAGRRLATIELRSLAKKLSLTLPIYEEIVTLSPIEFELKMKDFMVLALDKIYHSSRDLVVFSRLESKIQKTRSPKMTYFDRTEVSPLDEIPDAKVNKILSTIKPDPNYKAPEFLPDPIDDWMPKEKPIARGKPQALPTPDPDYISPEELPAPVDDWLEGL